MSADHISNDWPHVWSVQHYATARHGFHGTRGAVSPIWNKNSFRVLSTAPCDASALWSIRGKSHGNYCVHMFVCVCGVCVFVRVCLSVCLFVYVCLSVLVHLCLCVFMYKCLQFNWHGMLNEIGPAGIKLHESSWLACVQWHLTQVACWSGPTCKHFTVVHPVCLGHWWWVQTCEWKLSCLMCSSRITTKCVIPLSLLRSLFSV